jgi:hypothetical protein
MDDVVTAFVIGPGGLWLDEHVPVRDLFVGLFRAPLLNLVRDLGNLRADDERQPRGLVAFLLASNTIPASATTVMSFNWWEAILMVGSMVFVSALLPSGASPFNGNPLASVSSPVVIPGSRRRSLENPGSRNASPVSVSKYAVDTS